MSVDLHAFCSTIRLRIFQHGKVRYRACQLGVGREHGFQRACCAQETTVAIVWPDHLDAERKTEFVGAAGQRYHGMTNDGDRRCKAEPGHVVVNLFAIDLARIEISPGEWRYACSRTDQQVE